ncbi:hypothetical protein DIU36_29595 [Mucilaginibacter rubeus]|nr:hypothetical protein DIU36_29595 [Mucilaginibacter rubeus]
MTFVRIFNLQNKLIIVTFRVYKDIKLLNKQDMPNKTVWLRHIVMINRGSGLFVFKPESLCFAA